MSKLFGRCIINLRLKTSPFFAASAINIEPFLKAEDDISSFALTCTEYLSSIMTNQVLLHMSEMALNLLLFAKLETVRGRNFTVSMQKSLKIKGQGEKYADLVITVNKGKINECIYLIELKYMTKTEGADKSYESTLKKLIEKASCEVLEYKSALNFKDKNVKAYVMVFAGPDCVYCKIQ